MSYEINTRVLSLREHLNLTQTEFGKSIGVSRGVIANIELNIVDASTKPLLLQQICKEHNVDPCWLETGEGDMFLPKSKDDAIMEFMESVMADEEESFRRRFIEMLSALDDDGWLFLESTLKSLYPKEAKEKEQDP